MPSAKLSGCTCPDHYQQHPTQKFVSYNCTYHNVTKFQGNYEGPLYSPHPDLIWNTSYRDDKYISAPVIPIILNNMLLILINNKKCIKKYI
jgi:hypothetical protein